MCGFTGLVFKAIRGRDEIGRETGCDGYENLSGAISGLTVSRAEQLRSGEAEVIERRPLERTKEVQQILLARVHEHVEVVYNGVGLGCSGRRARPAAMLMDRPDQIRCTAVM